MNEPSDGVPPGLLPHAHLVSNFRFPYATHLTVDTIVDYLLQAPSITRHTSPMNWTFLDAPPDGTLLLVWQPTQLGINSASDGYIWADAEHAFSLNAKGCTVEMYVHRCGYQPGKENMATHCRRRYRLSRGSSPNMPIDSSLWLIHYTASERNHRLPSSHIPISPQIQHMLSMRRYLQSHGQLVRKEFMLHDRNNWPVINLPMPPPPSAPMYTRNPGISAGSGMQQTPFYPQQQHPQAALGPSPSKRPRTGGPGHVPGASAGVPAPPGHPVEPTIEEEEDMSHGDLLDHLTPREISMMRYKQHHEWMEEILSSPYSIHQIKPVDLELRPLIEHVSEKEIDKGSSQTSVSEPEGRSSSMTLNELRKRAAQREADISLEMDKIKKQHSRRMQRSATSLAVEAAEKKLRAGILDLVSAGNEFWRTDVYTQVETQPMADGGRWDTQVQRDAMDAIAQEVSTLLNKRIEVSQPVILVHRGGFEEDSPTSHSGALVEHESTLGPNADGDANMNNYAGHLLEQLGMSSTSTPMENANYPVVTQPDPSPADTFAAEVVAGIAETSQPNIDASQAPVSYQAFSPNDLPQPASAVPTMDVNMEVAGVANNQDAQAGESGQSAEVGDWILVGKDVEGHPDVMMADQTASQLDPPPQGAPALTNTNPPGVFVIPQAGAVQDLSATTTTTGAEQPVSETHGVGQYSHLQELEPASGVMAGFDAQGPSLSLGDTDGMALDDSAFGEALHGTETHPPDAPS